MIRKLQLDNSRIWRSFFRKLRVPVGFVTYSVIVGFAADFAAQTWGDGAALIVVALMVALPMAIVGLGMLWRDAAEEVDVENEQIMKRLRD
jgi:cytochrome c biogenesis protein CcdA